MALLELQAMELAMRELLSLLREKDLPVEEINASWARCNAVGGGAEAVLERILAAGPLDDEEREAVDRLMRLNAITREAVTQQQAMLVNDLARTRSKGAQMRGYAPQAQAAGGKCDLAG